MRTIVIAALLCSSYAYGALNAQPPSRKGGVRAGAPAPIFDHSLGDDEVIYRPPSTPIIDFGPQQQKFFDTDSAVGGNTKYWDSMNALPTNVYLRCKEDAKDAVLYPLVGNATIFDAATKVEFLQQVGMAHVRATTTRIEYVPTAENNFFKSVHIEFTTPRIISDPHMLSWPVTYIHAELGHHDKTDNTTIPNCRMYVESLGHNVVHLVNLPPTVPAVNVEEHDRRGAHGHHIRMGTPDQADKILASWGDDFTINWGHQYMSVHGDRKANEYHEVTGGDADELRKHFARTGDAKAFEEAKAKDVPFPAAAMAAVVGRRRRDTFEHRSEFHAMISYDEIYAQYYFGQKILPRWRCALVNQTEKCFHSMHHLIEEAWRDWDIVRTAAKQFDASLDKDIRQRGFGEHFLKIAHNAFRQTIAANNMAYAPGYPKSTTGSNYWVFQKEISSDGDVNTMDVIFPSSPLYLYYAPDLLRDMLVPVIQYALNKTWSKYTKPYSPHQLGDYPVSNITMPEQEVMPLENTGNMFLMLYGLLKSQNFNTSYADFFYPSAWPMFTEWADAMIADQLPFPPHQTCTDDFSGPTKNNTNLAAKGMISLHAYAKMCELLNPTQASPNPCSYYKAKAREYAKTFVDVGVVHDPSVGFKHVKLFFDSNGTDTWSTKYNFLWQRLLQMDGPFTAQEEREISENEHKLYLLKAKEHVYGFPLDSRFTFQKLDWMTWAFCFDTNVDNFKKNFADYGFKMANETQVRYPLTDLFNVETAFPDFSFRSRPVVGALFAPFLLFEPKQ